jgi:type IX secretion system PorP/SprF family membrane protein
MRSKVYSLVLCCVVLLGLQQGYAQGLHFSQFYNAPMLLNPANAALMKSEDYRLGLNYRSQWASLPAPYKTLSAYGDCQLFKQNETGELMGNWLGVGAAFFNDKAGDGELGLTKFQGAIAYHIQVGSFSMLSVGLSGGYTQRSVNFNKLTFNEQWDGERFDILLPNGEMDGVVKTKLFDVGAGINYAFFPDEYTYMKIGAGVDHINQPEETFFNGSFVNKVGIRPTGSVEALFRLSQTFTLNPSAYYTTQSGASEILFGTNCNIGFGGDENSTSLILGGFYRLQDAAIGVIGMQWGGMKIMGSYDYTISSLTPDNKGKGAFEMSVIFRGMYGDMSGPPQNAGCPRF